MLKLSKKNYWDIILVAKPYTCNSATLYPAKARNNSTGCWITYCYFSGPFFYCLSTSHKLHPFVWDMPIPISSTTLALLDTVWIRNYTLFVIHIEICCLMILSHGVWTRDSPAVSSTTPTFGRVYEYYQSVLDICWNVGLSQLKVVPVGKVLLVWGYGLVNRRSKSITNITLTTPV